jgi:hypothetical protein
LADGETSRAAHANEIVTGGDADLVRSHHCNPAYRDLE